MNVDLVLAPNPGLLTGSGTNTWVVSDRGEAVVIDPGPVIASHQRAIRSALLGFEPVAVLVTHTHPDHAPAASPLARDLGVPALARMEGAGFVADRTVSDGDSIALGALRIEVVATPGHTPDHTCYRVDDALFTGDHVIGGSTVIVDDMSDYLTSLRRLAGTGLKTLYPGHGPVIEDADAVLNHYIEHRLDREQQIVSAVESGASTVGEVVQSVYRDVDPALHRAAAVSVVSHLRKLAADGVASFETEGGDWDSPVGLAP